MKVTTVISLSEEDWGLYIIGGGSGNSEEDWGFR